MNSLNYWIIIIPGIFLLSFLGCVERSDDKRKGKEEKIVKNSDISKVEVFYYEEFPPMEDHEISDLKSFLLSKKELENFKALFPAKLEYKELDRAIDCELPQGWFTVFYKNRKNVTFHFCYSSKTKLHNLDVGAGYVLVPLKLYDLFVEAILKHAGIKIKFGNIGE